jgi:nicotinamide-nucleotide amidase
MTFPGVPWEMKTMWAQTAVPYLRDRGWAKGVIYSQMLKFWGMGESTLAQTVAPFLSAENPTVATYVLGGEVKLRISAKAASVEAAIALINPVAAEIRQLTGTACYAQDSESMAAVVGRLLGESGQTLSVAESCTGGGLGQLITAVPGSSSHFWGGIISYDNRVKQKMLGIDAEMLAQCGAVSDQVAQAMAIGVRDRLGTDWGLSITGIAGPGGGSAEKPVGLVYVGLSSATHTHSEKYLFGQESTRDQIRDRSAHSALNLLRLALLRQTDQDI